MLVGGIGGRIAMRVSGALTDANTSVATSNGSQLGEITIGGLAPILVNTAQALPNMRTNTAAENATAVAGLGAIVIIGAAIARETTRYPRLAEAALALLVVASGVRAFEAIAHIATS